MVYRRTPAVQARLDDQRLALVGAAAELLAERGYAACSVAAVAQRAGMASGTVYRHFPSKADLVAEVFRSVVGREVAAVRAAVRDEAALPDRIAAVITTFASRAMKSPRLAYALLTEPVDPVVDALRLEFRIAFRDIVADAIADGVRSGELPPQNPVVVAAALVGAIAEALAGPLAAGGTGIVVHVDPDTVPTLIRFAHRAIGVPFPTEE